MSHELIYVFLAGLAAGFAIAIGVVLVTRGFGAAAVSMAAATRIQALEADVAALRDGKADAERRLAAEERTAGRVASLERELVERGVQRESLRSGKTAAEIELAREKVSAARTRDSLTQAEARIAELEAATRDSALRIEMLLGEKANVEESLAAKSASLQAIQEQVEGLKARLVAMEESRGEISKRLETVTGEKADLGVKLATANEKIDQEMAKAAEKLALLTEAREAMGNEFKALADSVMTSHGETFAKKNKEQVEGILNPLREKLVEFQQGLQSAHTETAKDRATLAEQIRNLSETSARMTSETHNLTQALKGKAQTQGAWGEMILSTILERSGLREGDEYVKQESHTSEEGARIRPDVIVNLPGGQKVVIDAKVSLTAFEEHVNAANEVETAAALVRHVTSVRTHIRTLASKDYQAAVSNGLDYVVMFVPIEGALAVALREQPDLTMEAAQLNIAIATPTTLMMALRTVANVWGVERRNRNADVIAERAGKLYDKFLGFVEDMQALGGQIDRAKGSFDGAMGKLSTGRGNIVWQIERLKELGAKTTKAIPAVLLDDTESAPEPAARSRAASR